MEKKIRPFITFEFIDNFPEKEGQKIVKADYHFTSIEEIACLMATMKGFAAAIKEHVESGEPMRECMKMHFKEGTVEELEDIDVTKN